MKIKEVIRHILQTYSELPIVDKAIVWIIMALSIAFDLHHML